MYVRVYALVHKVYAHGPACVVMHAYASSCVLEHVIGEIFVELLLNLMLNVLYSNITCLANFKHQSCKT